MKIFNLVSLTFILLTFSSCSNKPINLKLSQDWTPLKRSQHLKLVRKQTQNHKNYIGLHLSFETEMIFLNSHIQQNNLKIKSQYKNWTQDQASLKSNELNKLLSSNTEFFMTFYSPKARRNKLDQKASDWKAILILNDSEVEGRIKLQTNISTHKKVFYPESSPWGKSYLVSFPISTKQIENSKFAIKIIGPEGMAKFKY